MSFTPCGRVMIAAVAARTDAAEAETDTHRDVDVRQRMIDPFAEGKRSGWPSRKRPTSATRRGMANARDQRRSGKL